MAQSPDRAPEEDDGFPWYVKAMLAVAILVVASIVVIDLLEFAAAL